MERQLLRLGQADGTAIELDIEELIETRLLITASSGGGKSGTSFQLCEQASGRIQQFIIDPEDEYAPLRAGHPFILVGPGGDIPITAKTAALIAHRLLQLGVSAILNLFELSPAERHDIVRAFIQALVDAPKALWHPLLVVLDEAHIWCPEQGEGSSVAKEAVTALASRGRKRGFVPVFVTQRLAAFDKTAASLCQNNLVGRTSAIDQKRAAEQLRIIDRKEKNDFFHKIGHTDTGQFYAYGRAFGITDAPVLFQVDRAATLPEKRQRRQLATPPTPASIQSLLPELADIPREAEEAEQSLDSLREHLRTAQNRIKELESASVSAGDQEIITMLSKQLREAVTAAETLEQDAQAQRDAFEAKLGEARALLTQLAAVLGAELPEFAALNVREVIARSETLLTPPGGTLANPAPARALPPLAASDTTNNEELKLGGPHIKILTAVAALRAARIGKAERILVALFAGYAHVRSEGFRKPLMQLVEHGYLFAADSKVSITGKGSDALPAVPKAATAQDFHAKLAENLAGPEWKILSALIQRGTKAQTREALCNATGYAHTRSEGFRKPLMHLVELGLAAKVEPDSFQASPIVFLGGSNA